MNAHRPSVAGNANEANAMVAIASRPADALPPDPALPPAYRLVTLARNPATPSRMRAGSRLRRGRAPSCGCGAPTCSHWRWCWSRTSRSPPRAGPSSPAWPRWRTRSSAFAPPEKPVTFALAGDDPVRRRAPRRRPPRLAGGLRRGRGAGLAGLLRHAPRGPSRTARIRAPIRGSTWLEEEGFDPAEIPEIAASFARHLMLAFDTWSERGFGPVAEPYLARLPKAPGDGRRGIDPSGNLLVHRRRAAAGRARRPAPRGRLARSGDRAAAALSAAVLAGSPPRALSGGPSVRRPLPRAGRP